MNFFKDANTLFIARWKTPVWAFLFLTATLIIYGINFLFRDVASNPFWMLWWAIGGSYSAALCELSYSRYLSRKEKELGHALANPSGYTWTIYNSDNAQIGDIAESDYLNAKHEADLCWPTKLLQGLNYLWVIYCTMVRLFVALPSLFLIILFALSLTTPHDQLSNITIGQIMIAISENWMLILNLLTVISLLIVAMLAATGKPAPGYKNFYGLRLKRLLARHVPNIANADGYRVDGWKIGVEK